MENMFKNKSISLILCVIFFLGVIVTAGVTMAFFGGSDSDQLEAIRLKNALNINSSSTPITSNFTALPGEEKDIVITGVVQSNGSADSSVGGLIKAKVNLSFDGDKPIVGSVKIVQDTIINGTQVYWNLADDGCLYLVSGSATSNNLFSVEPTTSGVDVALHLKLGIGTGYNSAQSDKNFTIAYQMIAGQDEVYSDGVLLSNTIVNIKPVFESLESNSDAVVSNIDSNVYTELSYIQSNATSTFNPYIDTGVKVTNNIGFEITQSFVNVTHHNGLGGYYSEGENMCFTNILDTGVIGFRFGSSYYEDLGNITFNERTYLSFNADGKKVFAANDVIKQINDGTFTSNTANFCLMQLIMESSPSTIISPNAQTQLYSAKIYESGALVRNLVPVRSPSGVLGLYDLLNNVFYQNSGTGNFVAGADKF